MTRPVVVLTGRHRPHELVFLAFAVTVGLAFSLGAPPPRSAAAEMPLWLVDVWSVGLLVHGVVGLAGVLLPLEQRRGMLLELGSMLFGSGALLIVAAAAFAFAGWGALLGGGFSLAWCVANLVRAWQIGRDLARLGMESD